MDSNLSKANEAHARRELFVELHGRHRLDEIKLLYQIWLNKDYQILGFPDFKSYMESPVNSGGLDISRPWAVQLIKSYQKYVIELGWDEGIFTRVSPRKLYALVDKATKDNMTDITIKAENTSLVDLQKERRGVEETTCLHERLEFMCHCRDCDGWFKDLDFINRKLLEKKIQ